MAVSGPVGVGVIGAGVISEIYLKNLTSWDDINVVAVADLVADKAEARAKEFKIKALTVEELLADPEIEIVLNLTIPKAHHPVAKAVLEAGKSVYNEKPLAVFRDEGKELVDLAAERGLLIGGAPDTFLGGSHQTCRKLIDDGVIGEPVGGTAFFLSHGPERWHPSPDFFYQPGGGPLFDMGPYYLTAYVTMLGRIRRVSGSARASEKTRLAGPVDKPGRTIPVEIPTHIAGVLDFENGAIGTILTSFDVWASQVPLIEIYGTKGVLSVPDPNFFGGQVRVRRLDAKEWEEYPVTFGFTENSRGLGVRDMARALRQNGKHRADGSLTYHVLDTMHAILEASESGQYVELTSEFERPEPLTEFSS